MSRRHRAEKREIAPDPVYKSILVAKFINKIMVCGKKSVARSIVYGAFKIIENKLKDNPVAIFEQALENSKPLLEVKSRRIGGATFQVPVEIPADRRISMAIKWLIQFSQGRSDKSMAVSLANEIMAAFKGEGSTIKKKEDMHKMAEANKAFSHFKW
jgi:small subunit ribosomal protein S7